VNLETVSAARWRIALTLTLAMMAAYFGFVLLVAFNKPLLATIITPGLSLGILLGALVIVFAWVLTWTYVRWANTHYDAALTNLRTVGRGSRPSTSSGRPEPVEGRSSPGGTPE
jgi:uncharacterized membrane protein (DUF485 family)